MDDDSGREVGAVTLDAEDILDLVSSSEPSTHHRQVPNNENASSSDEEPLEDEGSMRDYDQHDKISSCKGRDEVPKARKDQHAAVEKGHSTVLAHGGGETHAKPGSSSADASPFDRDSASLTVPAPTSLQRADQRRQVVTQPGAVRVGPNSNDDDEESFSHLDDEAIESAHTDLELATAGAPQVEAITREELQHQAVQNVKSQTTEAIVMSDNDIENSIKLERYERKLKRGKQLCCVGILLVAIVVGTVVGVTMGGGGSSSSSVDEDEGENPQPARGFLANTTASPTETPRTSLFEFIKSQLTGKDAGAFSNPSSSSARSYQALVDVLSTGGQGNDEEPNELLYAPDDPDSEYFAIDFFFLGIFFFDTGGPDEWSRNDGWMTGAPICTWHGIGCDGGGVVEAVRLPNNTMSGKLPENNDVFEQLRVIDLQHNSLGGSNTLPSSWGTYENLEELYLGYNGLSGDFPVIWSQNMDSLRIFDLQGNSLEKGVGNIRAEAALGKSYEVVRVGGNILSNDLLGSPWSSNLRVLDLSSSRSGAETSNWVLPDDFGIALPWPNITEIYLHDNPAIVGSISSQLCETVMVNNGVIKVDCERVACECCACS